MILPGEEFLSFVWKTLGFSLENLRTTDGESLQILSTGQINTHSGADFQFATIEIGGIKWAGAVEIHSLASDWHRHGHHTDPAYNNVILHVVWKSDAKVYRHDGTSVAQLELEGRVDASLYENYLQLRNSPQPIACASSLYRVPATLITQTISQNLHSRLARKSAFILELLATNRHDWEETAHQLLAKSLGFKVNAEPFFQLAKLLPFRVLRKHADNLLQLEAMAFGVAGFLDKNFTDSYLRELSHEYAYLSHKYKLDQLPVGYWKFLRLRPPNFPTIRIAQWAALINRYPNFFSRMLFWQDKTALRELFEAGQSPYWQSHYLPEKATPRKIGKLGKSAVDSLIINVVAPILAAYSSAGNGKQFYDKALETLTFLAAEDNHWVADWQNLGVKANSAFESQGLIELRSQNCEVRNCLNCGIGRYLVGI